MFFRRSPLRSPREDQFDKLARLLQDETRSATGLRKYVNQLEARVARLERDIGKSRHQKVTKYRA